MAMGQPLPPMDPFFRFFNNFTQLYEAAPKEEGLDLLKDFITTKGEAVHTSDRVGFSMHTNRCNSVVSNIARNSQSIDSLDLKPTVSPYVKF